MSCKQKFNIVKSETFKLMFIDVERLKDSNLFPFTLFPVPKFVKY